MKWSLNELHRYSDEPLHFDSTFDLKASLTKRFPDDILDAQPMKVDGYVTYHDGDATVSAHVDGEITVPSTRSLQPVKLPLSFDFSEVYTADESHLDRYEDDEVVFVLPRDHQTIDFDESLIENIYEQIPTRVLTPEEAANDQLPSGKGWAVTEEVADDHQDSDHVDPRFAKLKNLFPDQDEK
ncbi:YceD family protein [Limosilactobacillus caecicola]|uniref:YceD family protein n=1 Tax=Limosilactobacillus caecicola TaxID=2941332 RepID=UPI00203F6739|nr:YceD family protein [Limosilactobacillus caecicola]